MSNGLESHVNVGNMEVMGNADSRLKRFVDKNTSTQSTNADSRSNEESDNNIGKTNMNVNENEPNPSVLQEEARDDSSNRQQIDSEQQPEVHSAKLLRGKRVAGGKRIRNAHTMRKCLAEAGTSFENGVRRSKRITMRPLEYWKGERFLYDKSNPSVLEEEARNGTSGRRQIDPKQQPEFQVHAAKLLRGTRVAAKKRIRNSHPMLKSPAEAGTSFENGVRRSKRIRIRPLEHWKEKRFSYERADNKGRLDFASVKASWDATKPRKKGRGEPGVSAAREQTNRGLPPPPRGASMARKTGVTGGSPVSPLEQRSPSRAMGDQGVVALECGQKRPREEVTLPARKSGRGLSIPGVYRSERVESYFDVEDGGLAWRKSPELLSSFDLNLSEACSYRVLAEAAASRCAQLLNICTMMESRAKKYKGGTSQVEGDLQQVKEEVAQLQELLQRSKEDVKTLKEENKKLEDKLAHEYSTGEGFLSSMPGRGYKLSIEHGAAKAAVKDFTESDRFKELCKERALSIYDDIVKDCQRILRESGRVPEEVVLLLDGVEFEARVDDDSGDGERADAAGDDVMVDEVADEGGAENASAA